MKRVLLGILFWGLLGCQFLFSENYSRFKKDGLYGLITKDRTIVMQPSYGWIIVNSNSIIGFNGRVRDVYNLSLELLYSDPWGELFYYTEDEILITDYIAKERKLLNVITGNLKNFKGSEEDLVVDGYRDNIGLIYQWIEGKSCSYSIVDNKGNVLLTDIEEAHSVYTDGMIAVIMKDGKSGFVNKKGELVIETSFYINPDDIGPRTGPNIRYSFSEGYALVKTKDQKWIQFNIKGNKKILPDNIEPVDLYYKNGLVLIRDKETKKLGYMNPKFKIVIPCKFDEADSFVGKYAVVKVEGKDAIIDKKGNIYFSDDLR